MSAVQARGLGIETAGRWVGLVAGLAATSWLISTGDIALAVLLSGPLVGIALLGGVLLGEPARLGPERGPARRALLRPGGSRPTCRRGPGWSVGWPSPTSS